MRKRTRIGLALAAILSLSLCAGIIFRTALAAALLRAGLSMAGATEARLSVDRVGPTALDVSRAHWKLGSQPWSLDSLQLRRDHWYSSDLGDLSLRGLRGVLPLEPHVDAASPAAKESSGDEPVVPPLALPLRSLGVDGRITLQGPTQGQELQVDLKGRMDDDGRWHSELKASAPGLEVQFKAESSTTAPVHEFHLTRGHIDLARIGAFASDIAGMPPGSLPASGIVDLRSEGRIEGDKVLVSSFAAEIFGGRISTEPFTVDLRSRSVAATILAERLRIEQVMLLVKDPPAKASGEISGRVPLSYGPGGIVFGTGWLGLANGASAKVELKAEGLLTSGMKTDSPGYPVLHQIEVGMLKLDVTELSLKLHPEGPDAERSAVLRLSGHPSDPKIHAPVTIDLNFRGPIEQLLNAGIKSGAQEKKPSP